MGQSVTAVTLGGVVPSGGGGRGRWVGPALRMRSSFVFRVYFLCFPLILVLCSFSFGGYRKQEIGCVRSLRESAGRGWDRRRTGKTAAAITAQTDRI